MTEDCFQQTPLDFVGDKQWVIYKMDDFRTELPALRTREGTFPPGSQWTRNPLHPKDDNNHKRGHIIDKVQVPEDLEPGEYVLSFRWDCQKSSQVWNICANIIVI